MKARYLPIFWKFVIAIILTVSVFAILNISLVWNRVFGIINSEISKRIVNLGKNFANQSTHFILFQDLSSLQTLTDNIKKSDSIILYCFVLDNNFKILAHTFVSGFPKMLKNANKLNPGDSISVINIAAINYPIKNIKDIMLPILNSKLGYIRIGINDDFSNYELSKTIKTFIFIFIIFTILGILGAFLFSYIISNPIKKLKISAESIDLSSIDKKTVLKIENYKLSAKDVSHLRRVAHLLSIIFFKTRDEIDDLIQKFNEMIVRLESTYQELKATQKAMNQSERLASIGTLVAGIAHEINNPLSGLYSCIRRLSDQPERIPQNSRYLLIMNDAVLKIQNVVNGLLNFTRKTSGDKKEENLSQIIENALNLIKLNYTGRPIKIKGNYKNINCYLKCNRNEIEQVFFNLIKNSVDAFEEKLKINDKHNCEIEINVNRLAKELIIEIIDNGIGIETGDLTHIFDPFFTTKDIGKGAGLGLAVSYNVIKEHNGEIFVNSEKSKGTTFTIKFNTLE